MTEAQKYQKKKNILIILFMVLLVAFVCLICYFFIYAKNNPPETFLDPSEIEIVQMNTADYVSTNNQSYTLIESQNDFIVTENGKELNLKLTETNEIKLLREEKEESIEILQNETNINKDIKLIYQTENSGLILTNSGQLYKINDTNIENGQLKVGQVLTDMQINDFVFLGVETTSVFVVNSDNTIINADTLKEYNGVVDQIETTAGTVYIYADDSFGTEEGKMFIDESNSDLKINIAFDNKIITAQNIIYEINPVDGSLSTSNLGTFRRIGYKKNAGENTYTITLLTTTGSYDYTSNYYYAK